MISIFSVKILRRNDEMFGYNQSNFQFCFMSLRCLLIADASRRGIEIAEYLKMLRVELIQGKQSVNYDRSLLHQQIDVIAIAVSRPDTATFLVEELSRIVPDVKTIFLFDPDITIPWSFVKAIDSMVDWSIASDNLDRLTEIIDTIYDCLFIPIRRSELGVKPTKRELEVVIALQEGLKTHDICARLNMSSTMLDRYIGNLGIKFGCNGRIAIAIKSMREFGDLAEKV